MGILLRQLVGDKRLDGVSHVFVDEVHEVCLFSDCMLTSTAVDQGVCLA